MFTVNVKQDPRVVALLQRIAEAAERRNGIEEAKLTAIAGSVDDAVGALLRMADAGERVATAVEALVHPPREVVRVVTYQFNGQSFQSEGGSVMLTVKATAVPGTATVAFVFKDAEQNKTTVDSVSGLVASDPSIVDSIELATDGQSAKIHIGNNVGSTQLTLSVVENGEAKDYVDTLSVIPGDAVSADFVFSEVVPDPA